MPESINPGRMPQNYQRIEGSERRLAPGARLVRAADPDQILPVLIRVKAGAGRAGLDRVVAVARDQGLGLAETNIDELAAVLWGSVAQLGGFFAVDLSIYESGAETYRGFEGYLHLPGGLAEIVDNVLGLVEDEIEHIERVIGNLPYPERPKDSGKPRTVFDLTVPKSGPKGVVNPADFSLTQQFDMGWLLDPGCQRLLDNMQASPTAFQTVRVMKPFTSGVPETGIQSSIAGTCSQYTATSSSGTVWPAGGTIQLAGTLNALYELTSRGLIPFVVLGFFPDGIYTGTASGVSGVTGFDPSASALGLADWTNHIIPNWKTLIQTFFGELFDDGRFSATAISGWWFEVWNEPDNPVLWCPDVSNGDLIYYQQLYQATSEVVQANGYDIQLGGPAIMGPNVPTLMPVFVDFVKSNAVKCDFLSFHGKGKWDGCLNSQPSLQMAVDAADQTALAAQTAGLTSVKVVNDEADMRAFFAIPFLPRMTNQFPAWLTAMMIAYDDLSSQYAPIRCLAGSDNAELQLVGWTQQDQTDLASFAPAAFGQQRSIMTAASSWNSGTCPIDLLKVPAYSFYELLRLLGDQHGTFLTGGDNYYPHSSDLFHMITVAATHIGSVFCVYPPDPPSGPDQSWPQFNYSILGIPWPSFNWYQFQIDQTHSNGFNAAGGLSLPAASCTPDPFPQTYISLANLNADKIGAIRQNQELSVPHSGVNVPPLPGGRFTTTVDLPAYTTMVFWITQYTTDKPAPPNWETTAPYIKDTTSYGTNVVLRWQPDTDPTFYSYQVYRDTDKRPITPDPLRAALWVDTNPLPGSHTYTICTVNASGHQSDPSTPMTVHVP
jgi:Glycosyl hydrolases family 39